MVNLTLDELIVVNREQSKKIRELKEWQKDAAKVLADLLSNDVSMFDVGNQAQAVMKRYYYRGVRGDKKRKRRIKEN